MTNARGPLEVDCLTQIGVLVGVLVLARRRWILARLCHMEDLLPVCAVCMRIGADGEWVPLERYLRANLPVLHTRTLCPNRAKEPYAGEAQQA